MKYSFTYLLILAIALVSCKKDEEETLVIDPCGIDFSTTIHYGAVGDEFSSGLFISADSSWSKSMEQYIIDQGFTLSAFAQIGGEGNTAADLLEAMDNDPNAACKNLITLMCGTHDQLNGRSESQFQQDYTELLAKVISRAGSGERVVCVTIPDYSITPGLPASAGTPEEANADIQAYNAIITSAADAQGARLADIYPISQSAYQILYVPEDEFHPDEDHHLLWANVIAAQVYQALN